MVKFWQSSKPYFSFKLFLHHRFHDTQIASHQSPGPCSRPCSNNTQKTPRTEILNSEWKATASRKIQQFVGGKTSCQYQRPGSTWNSKKERTGETATGMESEKEIGRTRWHSCLPHCGLRCSSLTRECRSISEVDSWAKRATVCWYLCPPRRPSGVTYPTELFSRSSF